jgi:hypothetical protein
MAKKRKKVAKARGDGPTTLGRLFQYDQAVTQFPRRTENGEIAGWLQHTVRRIGPTVEARAILQDAKLVLGIDAKGRQFGIAYGAEHLKRIVETQQPEGMLIVPVILDGTADRAFPEDATRPGNTHDHDMELLMAIVLVVKRETGDLDEDGNLVNLRPAPPDPPGD